jgi:hypothetical protein
MGAGSLEVHMNRTRKQGRTSGAVTTGLAGWTLAAHRGGTCFHDNGPRVPQMPHMPWRLWPKVAVWRTPFIDPIVARRCDPDVLLHGTLPYEVPSATMTG